MVRGKHINPEKPFISKSSRDLKTFWPSGTDVNDWLKLQRRALRKAKTPDQKHQIKLIIESFEEIKELL